MLDYESGLTEYFKGMTKDGHSKEYWVAMSAIRRIYNHNIGKKKYGKFEDAPYPSPKRKFFRIGRFCPECGAKLIKDTGQEFEGRPPIYYELIAFVLFRCSCGYTYAYTYNPCPGAGML